MTDESRSLDTSVSRQRILSLGDFREFRIVRRCSIGGAADVADEALKALTSPFAEKAPRGSDSGLGDCFGCGFVRRDFQKQFTKGTKPDPVLGRVDAEETVNGFSAVSVTSAAASVSLSCRSQAGWPAEARVRASSLGIIRTCRAHAFSS